MEEINLNQGIQSVNSELKHQDFDVRSTENETNLDRSKSIFGEKFYSTYIHEAEIFSTSGYYPLCRIKRNHK
jgi:hypothetical protein